MAKIESFAARYRPTFDPDQDEWVLRVPGDTVTQKPDGSYEVRLPLYAGRALAMGGNILRPIRKKYRDWLLEQQGGLCAAYGEGPSASDLWNLDHQPPMASSGSKFIDYVRVTQNRVIHQSCDPAQKRKSTMR